MVVMACDHLRRSRSAALTFRGRNSRLIQTGEKAPVEGALLNLDSVQESTSEYGDTWRAHYMVIAEIK